MALSRPNKHLYLDEAHFEGYWVRLQALLRHNEDADEVLDGLLQFPLEKIVGNTGDDTLRAELAEEYERTGIHMLDKLHVTTVSCGCERLVFQCARR